MTDKRYYRGTVEYGHIGNGKFFARNDYVSTEFTPSPHATPLEVRSAAIVAIDVVENKYRDDEAKAMEAANA